MRKLLISAVTCVCLAFWACACSRAAKYEDRLTSGLEALAAGQFQDAVEQLEKAAKLRSDSATAYCNLGLAFAAVDETENAITSLLMAKDILKQDPRPSLLLADVLCRAGRCEEASKVLVKLNEDLPDQPNILTHMAMVHFKLGNMDEAGALLQEALDLKMDYPPALYNKAVLKRDHDGDAIGALRFFAKYLSVAGDGPYTERAREASAMLREVLPASASPRRRTSAVPRPAPPVVMPNRVEHDRPAPSLLEQASKAVSEKDFERALVLLKEATRAGQNNADALWQLATLYRDHLDQGQRAVATFRAFAESFPSDPRIAKARTAAGIKPVAAPVRASGSDRREKVRNLWQQALRAHRSENWDQAAALYEQVLSLDNRLGIAAYNLGLVYKSKGDFEAARKAFARAIEQSPAMVKARYMQAVVERELGETDKAIASASEVIRDDGNHDKAHLLLGLLYHESERFDKALIHFETALQLAPTAASREQAQAWVTSTARRNDAP